MPEFAHVPLIHGADGAKLSKRHGALGVDAYRAMGYLPEALCNYLLRLGWSHGDAEIISRDQAIEWFDLDAVGRAPARLDFAKLDNLNGVYMRQADPARLVESGPPADHRHFGVQISPRGQARIARGIEGLRDRAKTIAELARTALIYGQEAPIALKPEAAALLTPRATRHLRALRADLAGLQPWTAACLEREVRKYVEGAGDAGLKLKDIAQPLRAALTGSTVSPPIFDVMETLGREESLARLDFVVEKQDTKPAGGGTAVSA